MKLAGRTSEHKPVLARGPSTHSPRRSRSSRSRVSLSSLPARPRGGSSPWLGATKSRKNVCDGEVRDLAPGGLEHGHVRADEQHPLALAVLGREPLEQRVGVRREAHRERPALGVVADAVEDDDAARAGRRDEARERVDQLAPVGERARRGGGCSRRRGRASASATAPLPPRLVQQHAPRRRSRSATRPRPSSGIETSASQVRRTSGRSPLPSAPNTSATPPPRSASHIDVPPRPRRRAPRAPAPSPPSR